MAVPRRKEQSRVGSVALVAVAMMASMAFISLIPSPANAADASQLTNGALCAPSDQKFGEERDTADPDKGIATYVGGDMYVGKNPSTGVDAEGNITLSSSNAPDGSHAAGAEGLTVINGKLAMNPIKSSLRNDAATESNHNVNGGGGRRGPV